jgi:hypothetical protein
VKTAWSKSDIERFLALNDRRKASDLAQLLDRTQPAIEGMRRKLKRLRELGITRRPELKRLLALNEGFVQKHTLAQIRARARQSSIPVRPFLRRGLRYQRPGLVHAHSRLPQGGAA